MPSLKQLHPKPPFQLYSIHVPNLIHVPIFTRQHMVPIITLRFCNAKIVILLLPKREIPLIWIDLLPRVVLLLVLWIAPAPSNPLQDREHGAFAMKRRRNSLASLRHPRLQATLRVISNVILQLIWDASLWIGLLASVGNTNWVMRLFIVVPSCWIEDWRRWSWPRIHSIHLVGKWYGVLPSYYASVLEANLTCHSSSYVPPPTTQCMPPHRQ